MINLKRKQTLERLNSGGAFFDRLNSISAERRTLMNNNSEKESDAEESESDSDQRKQKKPMLIGTNKNSIITSTLASNKDDLIDKKDDEIRKLKAAMEDLCL